MRRIFTSIWRDGTWLEQRRPERISFGNQTLGQRIRSIPHTEYNNFIYVSWILFLFGFYVARVLLAFYMTATLSVTRGIELRLPSMYVSEHAFDQLIAGTPLKGVKGRVLIDPRDVQIVEAEVQVDGDVTLRSGEDTLQAAIRRHCAAATADHARRRILVAFRVSADASYQHLVSALDALQIHKADAEGCKLEAVIVSRRSR